MSLQALSSEKPVLNPPLLAILRVLIHDFDATIDHGSGALIDDLSFHKFSTINSSDNQIREDIDWDSDLVSRRMIENGSRKGQVIVPMENNGSALNCLYRMGKVGKIPLHPKYFHGVFRRCFANFDHFYFHLSLASFLETACFFYSAKKNKEKLLLPPIQKIYRIYYTQKNWKFHFTVGFKRKS